MRADLIELLADGELHSGADLARRLQCSRTAIWKQLRALRSVDLEVEATPGRGYRLSRPLELLDGGAIVAGLEPSVAAAIERLDVLSVVESTNEALRACPPPATGCMNVALAEFQTRGRGRRGRRWLSPFGSGLCMSAGWTFPVMPPALPALSLAAGVGVCRALAAWQPADLELKWPNDILAGGRKLGGLLIDVQGEAGGPISVVVGIGVNIDAVTELAERFDSADSLIPVGLRSVVDGRTVSRNETATAIVQCLFHVMTDFQAAGFGPFATEWRHRDATDGQPIRLRIGDRSSTGTALGVDDEGALLFDDGQGVRAVLSGDVTLRRAAAVPAS
ncbi:MAG: biotin--[acetyl-CoA-carboxylase] ligase [Gammaproteobacteria bacterium]